MTPTLFSKQPQLAEQSRRQLVYSPAAPAFGNLVNQGVRFCHRRADERGSILNVILHCEFTGNALYDYLPALSLRPPRPGAGATRIKRLNTRQQRSVTWWLPFSLIFHYPQADWMSAG